MGRAQASGVSRGKQDPYPWCGKDLGAQPTSLDLVLQEVSKGATEKHCSQALGVGVEGPDEGSSVGGCWNKGID